MSARESLVKLIRCRLLLNFELSRQNVTFSDVVVLLFLAMNIVTAAIFVYTIV